MELYSAPPRNFSPIIIPEDVPVYRLKSNCFFYDREIIAGTVIEWEEVPNTEMQPLNLKAKAEMEKYLDHLDACGEAKAKLDGKSHASLRKTFDAQNKKKRSGLHAITEEQTPLMGKTKKDKHIRVVGADEVDPLDVIVANLESASAVNKGYGKTL